MKKKIAILGSTGSIGKSTINILKKDKKSFDIVLLTTNNNYKEILKQSKEFKVRNLIINNKKNFLNLKKKLKNKNIKIFNNFESFKNKFNNKIDFTMSAISGLEGLKPTIDIIKFTKTIAIANKESLICGWNLIQKSNPTKQKWTHRFHSFTLCYKSKSPNSSCNEHQQVCFKGLCFHYCND